MACRFFLCLLVLAVSFSGCSNQAPPPPSPTNTPVAPTATPRPQAAGIPPTPYIKVVADRALQDVCDRNAEEIDETQMPDANCGVVDTNEVDNWRDGFQVYFGIQQASGEDYVDFAQHLLWGYGHTDQNCPEMRFSSSDLPLPLDRTYRWKAVVTKTTDVPPVPVSDWQYSDGFTIVEPQ